MRPDDLIMVSVDDHVVEPPTMFDGRLPASMQEQAPRVVRRSGRERCVGVQRGQDPQHRT